MSDTMPNPTANNNDTDSSQELPGPNPESIQNVDVIPTCFCSKCGAKIARSAKFCSECGSATSAEITKPNLTPGISASPERVETFTGVVYKCPNCGEKTTSFAIRCTSCGFEFRHVTQKSSVEILASKLERAASTDKRVTLIRDFPIPNTREDIYEFFILATSNLATSQDDADAWSAKLEQVYQKARLSFGTTAEFEYLDEMYKKAARSRKKNFIYQIVAKSKGFRYAILFLIGLILMMIGQFDTSGSNWFLSLIGLMVIFCTWFIALMQFMSKKDS